MDEPQGRGRSARHLANGGGQCEQPEISSVVPEDAGKRPVDSRMRPPGPGDTGGGERETIGPDEHGRRPENFSDVLFRHARDHDPGGASIGDETVADGIDGIAGPVVGDLGDRLAGILRLAWRDGDPNGIPGRNASKAVQPVRGNVGADARARRRRLQPVDHRRVPSVLHPQRQQVAQRVAGSGIRILVAIDLEAAAPGRVDDGQ